MEIPLSTVVITHIFSLGKKRCWVYHGKNAYVEAEVKESDADGKIIVETSDGEVKKGLIPFGVFCILCLVRLQGVSFL